MPESGGEGGVNADGYFVPVPICYDFNSCIDPTGLLFGGRPREDATRQVVAKSARSPHHAYRRWGLCVANLLFRDNLVISSSDQRERDCAANFVKDLEASVVPIPFNQAHGLMVQSYSRYAQDPSTPVPLRLQNASGDYPPPEPLDHIYRLATQVLDAAHQTKLVLDIGQCILEAGEWPLAVECITAVALKYGAQRLVVNAIKWVVRWITDHHFDADRWDRLQDRIEKWKAHREKNEDPPMPMGMDESKGGAPLNAIPLPLDTPIPLAAAQHCKSCSVEDFDMEDELNGDLREYPRSDDSSPGPRSVLQGISSIGSSSRGRGSSSSYQQTWEVLRMRNQSINFEGPPGPIGFQARQISGPLPY